MDTSTPRLNSITTTLEDLETQIHKYTNTVLLILQTKKGREVFWATAEYVHKHTTTKNNHHRHTQSHSRACARRSSKKQKHKRHNTQSSEEEEMMRAWWTGHWRHVTSFHEFLVCVSEPVHVLTKLARPDILFSQTWYFLGSFVAFVLNSGALCVWRFVF